MTRVFESKKVCATMFFLFALKVAANIGIVAAPTCRIIEIPSTNILSGVEKYLVFVTTLSQLC